MEKSEILEIYAEVETVPAYNRIKSFLAADWRHLHDGLEAGGGVCRADQTCSCDTDHYGSIVGDKTDGEFLLMHTVLDKIGQIMSGHQRTNKVYCNHSEGGNNYGMDRSDKRGG